MQCDGDVAEEGVVVVPDDGAIVCPEYELISVGN